jgi:tetratricopeptide (TPR) repeat protein
LASLLVDSGVSTGPDQLIPQVYLPAREGSLQADLISATRRAGRLAYPVPPQLDTLLAFIDEGLPVLVLQDLGFLFGHQWHYAVVFGYRLHGQEVLLRSGDQREVSMTVDAFERTWAPGGRWAIAALPPSPIPAPVDEARWVREAASLERTDARAAASAYRAALSRWPNSALAHFGLGNLAYAAGDVPGARAHFEALTQSHPDLADAWNNLAQVLLDLGDIDLASKAVERAIMLGGEHQSQFFQTRDAIRAGHEQRSPHTP